MTFRTEIEKLNLPHLFYVRTERMYCVTLGARMTPRVLRKLLVIAKRHDMTMAIYRASSSVTFKRV